MSKSKKTSALAGVGEEPAEEAVAKTYYKAPYVGFYGPKKTKGPEIIEGLGLGALTNGHPYIYDDEEGYIDAAELKFTILKSFPYWVRFEKGTYRAEAVWTSAPEGKYWEQDIKQCILALMLHVAEDGTAFCSVADLQGVKAPAGLEHNAAIIKSKTDGFARKHGDLVSKAPPCLRVFSTFNMKPSRPDAQFPHVKAHAKAMATDAVTWDALVAWGDDKVAQAQRAGCEESFDFKAGRYKKLA